MSQGTVVTERSWSPGASLRVAMVVYGDITHDSRVQREANSLARAGHSVTIFCLGSAQTGPPTFAAGANVVVKPADRTAVVPGSPSPFRRSRRVSRIRGLVDRVGWLFGYARNLRAWGRSLARTRADFDVWHAHDFAGLVAIGGALPRGVTLVYDVHDLFTETGTGVRLPEVLRRAIRWYERRLVRGTELVVAVNQGVADMIDRRCLPRAMIVVHNCPPRWIPPEPRPDLIREEAGLPPDVPVILYHGLLSSQRGLDRLVDAMLEPELARAHLALLGYGELREWLTGLASEARFGGRIRVLDPVPPAELMPWVASADVGFMAMPDATLNLYLSTPNKLFECLAAGTPVVVSDFPAVRYIVIDDPLGPLGVTCDPSDARDIARALSTVIGMDDPARLDLRRRCLAASSQRWNWESEVERLVGAYQELGVARRATPPAGGQAP